MPVHDVSTKDKFTGTLYWKTSNRSSMKTGVPHLLETDLF